MSDAPERYDAIVIGSGQGGNPLAKSFAAAGRKTAMVERLYVGGTCINFGCTPTKTMIASARVAYVAQRAEEYGVGTGAVRVDAGAVRQRKRDLVERFRSGTRKSLEGTAGPDLVSGEATFVGPRRLEVHMNAGGVRTLAGDTIVIDVGGRPKIPQIDGLESVPYLDSTSAMELDVLPRHLLVMGGGYVGLELAQMFRRFGSEVTVIERGGQIASGEDPDVAEALQEILEEEGVRFVLGSGVVRVRQTGGELVATLEHEGRGREVAGSHLLVATGRRPNTDGLGLEAAGVKTDERGHIRVTDRLETTAKGVYALGDVTGAPAFTHVSYDHYRILRANLLEGGAASTEGRMLPYTVFTDPQLGRVGLSEKQAAAQGKRYALAKLPMKRVARASELSETRGLMKALVDPDTERILGCAVLGIEGGELMSMIQIAMMGNLPYTALREGIFAHPTLAESLNNLFATVK